MQALAQWFQSTVPELAIWGSLASLIGFVISLLTLVGLVRVRRYLREDREAIMRWANPYEIVAHNESLIRKLGKAAESSNPNLQEAVTHLSKSNHTLRLMIKAFHQGSLNVDQSLLLLADDHLRKREIDWAKSIYEVQLVILEAELDAEDSTAKKERLKTHLEHCLSGLQACALRQGDRTRMKSLNSTAKRLSVQPEFARKEVTGFNFSWRSLNAKWNDTFRASKSRSSDGLKWPGRDR